MSLHTNGIMNLLSTLGRSEHLNVIMTQRFLGCVFAGLVAALGSLILGTIGAALAMMCVLNPTKLSTSGALGGYFAAVTGKDFTSVGEVLSTMEYEKKEQLAERVREIMRNVGVSDLAVFAAVLTSGAALRNQVLDTVVHYLKDEMNMAVVKG